MSALSARSLQLLARNSMAAVGRRNLHVKMEGKEENRDLLRNARPLAPLWVEMIGNRRVHFIAKNLFPMSSGVSKWASERRNERSGARELSDQCGESR